MPRNYTYPTTHDRAAVMTMRDSQCIRPRAAPNRRNEIRNAACVDVESAGAELVRAAAQAFLWPVRMPMHTLLQGAISRQFVSRLRTSVNQGYPETFLNSPL